MRKLMLFLMVSGFMFGQNINILPKILNPEVSSIGKFLDNPVNLNTGQISTTIDLITLEGSDYNIPISLNYNSSGIRVSEISSRVGLGWSINTGGFITRTVKGQPDDSSTGFLYAMKIQNFLNLPLEQKAGIAQFGENDLESDLYTFTVFGISGSFYFGQDGTIINQSKTDILIEPKFSNNKIIGWKITNTDGIKYYLGLSKDEIRKATDTTSSGATTNLVGGGWTLLDHTIPSINVWHILDVETTNNKLISYEYDNSEINFWNLHTQENYILPIIANPTPSSSIQTVYINNIDKTNRVKKITSDIGTIEFLYELPREDLLNDFALNKILLKKGTIIIDSYTLNYNYHISNSFYNNSIPFENQQQRTKRLMLQSVVQNKNNTENKKYTFEYFTDKGFPERLSFSQDHWGYFNGKKNMFYFPEILIPSTNYRLINSLGGNKKVDEAYSNALSLKKITYPTGGFTLYEYESNKSYSINAEPWIANYTDEILLEKNTNNVNGSLEETYLFSNLDINNSYFYWEIAFDYPCSNPQAIDCPYAQLFLFVNGNYKLISDTRHMNLKQNFLIPHSGNLNIKIKYFNYSQQFNENLRNDLTLKFFKSELLNSLQVPVGGIRIKEIKSYNKIFELITTKKFNYNFFEEPNISSGITLNTPVFLVENFPLGQGDSCTLLKSDSVFPLNDNGNSVQYTEVEEINNDGKIGKIEYYFSFVQEGIGMIDNQMWKEVITNSTNINVGNLDSFNYLIGLETPKENFSKRRGLLLKKKSYAYETSTNNYFPVLEEINTYDFSYQNFQRQKNLLFKRINGHFAYSVYNNICLQNVNLLSKKSKMYLNSGIVEEISNYKYDPYSINSSVLLREEEKIESNNNIKTKYSYARDTNNLDLITKNMVGIPLITEKFNNTDKLTTQEIIYKNWGNNLLAPEIIKVSKGNQPLENKIKYNVLDNSNGNPLELQQESGMKISYIYGYNKTQPVAKLENIAYSAIPNALITAIQNASNGTDEQALINALAALRTSPALANAMITTLTYKPLIGVSTITDPKGDKQTYHYDSFNRLQFVKDKNGNILSENEYHYKN